MSSTIIINDDFRDTHLKVTKVKDLPSFKGKKKKSQRAEIFSKLLSPLAWLSLL